MIVNDLMLGLLTFILLCSSLGVCGCIPGDRVDGIAIKCVGSRVTNLDALSSNARTGYKDNDFVCFLGALALVSSLFCVL